MVRLLTLGGTDLRDAKGAEVRTVLVQPRRLALLACLALARGSGFLRRDRLLAMFWPEDGTERARACLNRAVYFLRHQLGDGIVLSRGSEELGVDPDRLWCDAGAFEMALAAGDWQRALELYRGDLLPAFFVSGASGFDEWLETERTRLRALASNAAVALRDAESVRGDLTKAVHWARRATGLAPFDELELRALVRLLDRLGDRAGALRAYHEFVDGLASQLGIEPSHETVALAEAIRSHPNGRSAAGESTALDTTVVERSAARAGTARPRIRLLALGAAAAAVAAGFVLVRPLPVDPLRVEVTRFENASDDASLDPLGTVATERLFAGLVRSGVIRPDQNAPGWTGWRLAAEMDSGGSEPPRAQGRAGTVVSGSWERHGDSIRLRARIIDQQRDRVWELPVESGTVATAGEILSRVDSRVAGGVAVLADAYYASLLPLATIPPAASAWQEFKEALDLEARQADPDIVQRFRLAAALDTSFRWPVIHAALSALKSAFPRAAQADSLLRELEPARQRMSPLERHLIAYMLAVRAEDWEGCYRAIRAAASTAPEQFSYTEAIRATQLQRPRQAVAALTRPGLERIYRDDARNYWFVLTSAHHQLGEYRLELQAARRARLRNPASSSLMLQEIRALAALGRLEAVRARLDSLQSLPRDGWFVPGVGLMQAGAELLAHGHEGAAQDALARAIAWYRSRPVVELRGESARYFLGWSLVLAGRLASADSVFRGLYEEHPDNVDYIGLLGTVAARRGDRAGAHRLAAQLEGRGVDAPLPGELSIVWRARIAALLGDSTRAMQLLLDAYGPQGTMELHGDTDFDGMKDYAPFREFIRPKG